MMVAKDPPFKKSKSAEDNIYKTIYEGKAEHFWKYHEKHKPAGYFSDDFKHLVLSLLDFEPTQRPSISECVYHPWTQLDVPTAEDIKTDLNQRIKAVMEKREERLNQ